MSATEPNVILPEEIIFENTYASLLTMLDFYLKDEARSDFVGRLMDRVIATAREAEAAQIAHRAPSPPGAGVRGGAR